MRTYYAVYSHRGFRNEITVRTFDTKGEASTFKDEVNSGNYGNDAYTFSPKDSIYHAGIREAKKYSREDSDRGVGMRLPDF